MPGGRSEERLVILSYLLDFVPHTDTSYSNKYKYKLKHEITMCSRNVMCEVDLIQSICHNKGQDKNCVGLF